MIICKHLISPAALLRALASYQETSEETVEIRLKLNIILIVSDDQGYNDMGAYGSREIITPHKDKLAEEEVRLTNF